MFTGIIEDVGKTVRCTSGILEVDTRLTDIRKGDSIAVNGVCLTATSVSQRSGNTILLFDFTPETSSRTNIGDLKKGSPVNLERSLRVGDRFSGHIMTGHIEGTGKTIRKTTEGNSWIFVFSVDPALGRYIVPKGSIGVDGISLTVVDATKDTFSVSIIPHTLSQTNLQARKRDDRVNIEPDILAKYVEHLIGHKDASGITEDTLRKHGFLS